MSDYSELWYRSADGLRLFARDYPCRDTAQSEPQVVLCMHGLTRNSADFAGLAAHLSARFRVLAVDVRGRGRSDRDPQPSNYTPLTYAQDMFTLLDHLGVQRAILCGTSMGGLMSFVMAATAPARIAGMILNDIGPEVDPAGLERIKGYVGKMAPVTSWDEAAGQVREMNAAAFPDFGDDDWMTFARALFREVDGVPVLNYDTAIAQPLDQDEAAVPQDLWPLFAAIAAIPMLVVRGELSDILAPACVATMRDKKPDLQVVEIPRRGHAPTLDEPQARAAIDAFLGSLA